jgi:hypothetical protein
MLGWIKRRWSRQMADRGVPAENLARVQHEYAGAWVAMKGGEVVEARPTPYELIAALHERGIVDATVVRMPAASEPELIGLG